MFNNIARKTNVCIRTSIQILFHKHNCTKAELVSIVAKENTLTILDTSSLPNDDFVDIPYEKKSPLEESTEDISHVAPYLKPTFNFAAYINKSETLQQLLKLGVNLHKLEQKVTVPPFILGLDFEKHIKYYVQFLHDTGLTVDEIGATITKNPFILKEDISDLKVRINYLISKKFTSEMILRILCRNPFWLMFSTERIDRRLGFFQKEYSLTGNEVRMLANQQPKLITYTIKHIKLNHFTLKEEMGFSVEDIKSILLKKPNIFMKNSEKMLLTYAFMVNTMKIPLEMLVTWPELLTCREFRIKQRHLFLDTLGRAQYDPKKPNYVALLTLVSGSDGHFAVDVAKSSLQTYNAFLKSL